MAKINTFRELDVWKYAHELVLNVYTVTKKYPREELFALVTQVRRAAVSVPSNIVEGFRRKSLKDSIHFYNISDASLEEVKYQLFLSSELGYITQKEYTNIYILCEQVGAKLTRWIQSQEQYL